MLLEEREKILRAHRRAKILLGAKITSACLGLLTAYLTTLVLYPRWFASDQSHGVLRHGLGTIVSFYTLPVRDDSILEPSSAYSVAIDRTYLSGLTGKFYRIGEKVAVDYTVDRSGRMILNTVTPVLIERNGQSKKT
jgi:hypothetical protein